LSHSDLPETLRRDLEAARAEFAKARQENLAALDHARKAFMAAVAVIEAYEEAITHSEQLSMACTGFIVKSVGPKIDKLKEALW
jgi:hypothetical protein